MHSFDHHVVSLFFAFSSSRIKKRMNYEQLINGGKCSDANLNDQNETESKKHVPAAPDSKRWIKFYLINFVGEK